MNKRIYIRIVTKGRENKLRRIRSLEEEQLVHNANLKS